MRETCQQYVARRLSEGWGVAGQFGHTIFLSPPDGSFLRPVDLRNSIETLRPNAVGDETSIADEYPDGAAHWSLVDEAPSDGDSTFIYTTSTTYQRDLYNLPPLSGSGPIISVSIYFRIRSTYAIGTYARGQASQKSGGTVTDGTEQSAGFIYALRYQAYPTNPATGNPYTVPEVNDLQIGLRLRDASGAAQARCTQVYIEVTFFDYKDIATRLKLWAQGFLKVTETLRPNAAGDETSIAEQYPASGEHWDKVDEAVPDNGTTCVETYSNTYQRDLYNLPAPIGKGTILSVKVYFRCCYDIDATSPNYNRAKPSLKTNGTVVDGSEITPTQYPTWTTYFQEWKGTNPATGLPWGDVQSVIGDLQIGVSLKGRDASYQWYTCCTQVCVEVVYIADIATRFKLLVRGWKDIATRFKLWAQGWKDAATRFKLWVQGWKDVAIRFKLWGRTYNDIATRFYLQSYYKDIPTRFRLRVAAAFPIIGGGHIIETVGD